MNINVLETVFKMVKNTNITDLELKRGETLILMKLTSAPTPPPAPEPILEDKSEPEKTIDCIKSNTVGFFYDRKGNAPDPIIKVGETIKKGQIVGFISSMGTVTPVKSTISGVVVAKKCENKDPVEYGEIIFEVERV